MDIAKITKNFGNAFEVKKITESLIQIQTSVNFPNGKPIVLFLEKQENIWILNDKKQILKFMNEMYVLDAKDIKNCIKSVLLINKAKMKSGLMFLEIPNEDSVPTKVLEFLMFTAQLVNMRAFFEEPV
ncbi:MAG: hypothetical protein PHQ62_00445 [Clostridia bacterium]|nr:hypothetical protein [Clostridia bacterium]